MEKERKLDAIIGLYPLSSAIKNGEDGLSADKSTKTNPLVGVSSKVKGHNRTQSDAIIKNPKLLQKFIQDARLLNFVEQSQNKVAESKQFINKASSKSLAESLAFKNRFKQSFSAKKSRRNVLSKQELDPNSESKQDTLNKDFETTNKTDIDNTLTRVEVTDLKSSDNNISTDFRFTSPPFIKSSNLNHNFDAQYGRLTPEPSEERVKLLCTVNAHLDAVHCVEFNEDNVLATFGADACVKLWDVAGARGMPQIAETKTLRYHLGSILSSAITPGFLFSGDSHGAINVFKRSKTSGYEHARAFRSGPEPVWSMSFNSSNQLLASSSPNKLKLWDVHQISAKNSSSVLITNTHTLGACDWSSVSTVVVYSYEDKHSQNEFVFLDVNKSTEKYKISHANTFCNRFKIKQENLLLAANENHTVGIYDVRSQALAQEFVAHSGDVTAIEFDEVRGMLMTGGSDSSLRLWDIRTLRCIQEFTLHKPKYDESIFDIKHNSSLGLIVTAGADATVRFFQTP